MSHFHFIRITDVAPETKEGVWVHYFEGDAEREILWIGAPPSIGEVWEGDLSTPEKRRRISAPEAPLSATSDAWRWRRAPASGGLSRMEVLRRRHLLRTAVRGFLNEEGFIEIDAPLLVHGASPDIAIDSFAVGDRWLVSSTEYQMKRLAIGGFEKIYSLTQNFREGDTGTFRNPEFTMLEWGRVGGRLRDIEKDAEGFILAAMRALGLGDTLAYQGKNIDMRGPWPRISVTETIARLTGIDVSDFSAASLVKAAEAADMPIKPDWREDRDFLFSLLMDHLQPRFGEEKPVFLCDWPGFQTTSAAAQDDGTLVQRSELFIAGVELSDGFAGLADAALQTWLFDETQKARARLGQKPVAIDTMYIDAMREGAPYGAGMALGFDRLVMLLTDQPTIRSTLAFAWDEV